jgi:serine/tyrosine/threonine adenylyltransferase
MNAVVPGGAAAFQLHRIDADLEIPATVASMTQTPPPTTAAGWRLENSYALLPPLLHSAAAATPVARPRLVILNRPLATALGLDADVLEQPGCAGWFTGNLTPPGAKPLAQAYAGHQFGHFTGLGDGRALLLGEQITPDGGRFDIQLKGSGRTPYSRGGDGRAALGPMLREFLISEAMHALGIPTTRSLAVAITGEAVMRDRALPGAVLVRVASSHIRVGTFQWAAAHRDHDSLEELVRYTLRRHHPQAEHEENPALTLLQKSVHSQAALIARWMCVGFIHGVMNTDNMALSGETIDYGPCAFMDAYDPDTVFSSIDRHGRYACGRQPEIAQWNLARLAEALLPLIHPEESRAMEAANDVVAGFMKTYQKELLQGMGAKLGLADAGAEDHALIDGLLDWMRTTGADFTNTFATLSDGMSVPDEWLRDPAFQSWHLTWQERLKRGSIGLEAAFSLMRSSNPAVIPRNHKVEEALDAAVDHGDLLPFRTMLEILTNPYQHSQAASDFRHPAPDGGAGYQTFCGT